MDDAGIGAVIKVKGMCVESIQKHGFLQRKATVRANRLEDAFLWLRKLKLVLEFVPLKFCSGTGHCQIIQQGTACPGHD